jgi:hypothetical protein
MALKRVVVKLYIYTGTSGSYTASDLKYTLEREIISTRTNILIEIAELVRDYISFPFNNYAKTYNIGSVPTDLNDYTKWVSASVQYFDDTDTEYSQNSPQVFTYLALDGYGIFEEGINPALSTNALITTDNIYLPENTAQKIPIFAEGVGKFIVDSTTTQVTDSGNTNQKIQYITVTANASEVKIYDTDDATLRKTITVNQVCEPKYTTIKCTFVNKYGAFQDVFFFKKSTERFQVTDTTFNRNIIDASSVSYNTYEGQKERYNLNASSSITLNTGYVVEDFNSAIEEMFLSENVWLRIDSKTLPVIPKNKSFVFKTSLNDRVINHTVDFDFAFDKINNVR